MWLQTSSVWSVRQWPSSSSSRVSSSRSAIFRPLPSGEAVVRRQRDHEVFLQQCLTAEAFRIDGIGDDGKVQRAFRQLFHEVVGLILQQHEAQLRKGTPEGGGDPGQQIGRDGGNQSNPEFARQRVLMGPRGFHDFLDPVENQACPVGDLVPEFGDHDTPLIALDELHAELLLELFDLCAERRLADETALRRPSEVVLLGQGDEVTECPDTHP